MNKLISIEDQIIWRTIMLLLAAGFEISVFDSEETTLFRSQDVESIYAAMGTSDEDYLYVYRRNSNGEYDAGAHYGWVRFIYGNDDVEVINDYTTNLEPIMCKITDMINEFEKARGG